VPKRLSDALFFATSRAGMLTYVKAVAAQKAQNTTEAETAPPSRFYRNRSSFSLALTEGPIRREVRPRQFTLAGLSMTNDGLVHLSP
jgi:hypothetical protein